MVARALPLGLISFAVVVLGAGMACGGRTGLFAPSDALTPADAGSLVDAPDVPPADAAPLPWNPPCVAPLGLQPHSPWPIARRCPARAGHTDAVGTSSPTVAWRAAASTTWGSDVVVAADGTVYAIDLRRGLVALGPGGAVRWVTAILPSGASDASLAIGVDGTVYAWNGNLTAIRPDGTIAWTSQLGGDGNVPLDVGHDGTLYVTAQESALSEAIVAIAPDGQTRWRFPLGPQTAVFGMPAVGEGGTLLVTTGLGVSSADGPLGTVNLQALEPEGSLAWTVPLGDAANFVVSPSGAVVGDDGTIYASCVSSSASTGICSFGPDATPLRTTALPRLLGRFVLSPGEDLLYATTVAGGPSDAATAFQLAATSLDGLTLWSVDDGDPFDTPLVDAHGSVFLATPQQTSALTPSGDVVWTLDGGPPVAMGADGTIYALDDPPPGASTTLVALAP